MDTPFFCPDCRCEHAEPAEAILGHVLLCLGCAMHRALQSFHFDTVVAKPLSTVDQARLAA